jgi:hypothetical protein
MSFGDFITLVIGFSHSLWGQGPPAVEESTDRALTPRPLVLSLLEPELLPFSGMTHLGNFTWPAEKGITHVA